MNENIVILIKQLSALAIPADPNDINQLFAQFPIADQEVLEQPNLHYDALLNLKLLITSHQENDKQLHYFRGLHSQLDELHSQKSALSKTLLHLEEKLAKSHGLLIDLFGPHYDKLLQTAITFGVPCTKENTTEQLAQLKETSELKLEILTRSIEQLKQLQLRFAEHLSMPEIYTKKDEIDDNYSQNIKALEKINQDIMHFSLSDNLKKRLQDEFQASSNSADLIESYRNKIDSTLSYKSLTNWAMGTTDPAYGQHQKEFSDSVDFLQLLQNQKLINLKTEGLKLNQLLLNTAPSPVHESNEQKNRHLLLTETTKLLNSLSTLVPVNELKSPIDAADYYLIVLNSIPVVARAITERTQSLEKLNDLITFSSELEQLKSKPAFTQEIIKLISKYSTTESIRNNELEFLDEIFQYKRILNEIQLSNQFKNDIEKQIDLLNTELDNSKALEELINQSISLEEELSFSLESIKKLPFALSPINIPEKSQSSIIILPETPTPQSRSELSKTSRESNNFLSNQSDFELEEDTYPEDTLLQEKWPLFIAETEDEELHDESTAVSNSLAIKEIELPLLASEVPIESANTDYRELDLESTLLTKEESQSPQNSKKDPLSAEIQITNLQSDIPEKQILASEQVKVHSTFDKSPPNQAILPKETFEAPAQLANDFQLSITLWHEKNCKLLENLPSDIQNWYTELYQAGQLELTNELILHKFCHLIKDILFELENKNHQDILREYMRLCPEPLQGINNLLEFKPGLIILNNSTDLDCIEKLKPHYLHCTRLKKTHPIEAELMTQALQSIQLILTHSNENKKPLLDYLIPKISTDPRYLPLKRHRGFLRVWEAIEDFFKMLIGKITGKPTYTYNQTPCLFSTRSNRILEKEEGLLKKLELA